MHFLIKLQVRIGEDGGGTDSPVWQLCFLTEDEYSWHDKEKKHLASM